MAIICLATCVIVSTAIIYWAFKWLNSQIKVYGLGIILLAVPVFAVADFAVSWLTSLVFIGPQGSFDSTTPLGSPGLLLAHTPLRFAARLVGLYGLSALVWTFVFIISHKKLRKSLLIYLTFVVLVSLMSWGLYKPSSSESVKVKLVSETLDNQLPAIKSEDAKLIVFPEYGFDGIESSTIYKRIVPSRTDAYFVVSRSKNVANSTAHLNQLIVGSEHNGFINVQDKHRLIPNGEDASYAMNIILRATGQKAVLDYFGINRQVIKGKHQLVPVKISDQLVLGSGICSSITSPEDYRSFTRRGATVLTNSASLDIFSGSRVFAWQQKSLATFMAVANARPFVQSANSAESFALDANGKILASRKKPGVVNVGIMTNSRITMYTITGDWLVWAGLMVSLFMFSKSYIAPISLATIERRKKPSSS